MNIYKENKYLNLNSVSTKSQETIEFRKDQPIETRNPYEILKYLEENIDDDDDFKESKDKDENLVN